jgi:hypothetical protein
VDDKVRPAESYSLVRTLLPRSEPRHDTVSVTAFRYLPPLTATDPVTVMLSVEDEKYLPPVIAIALTVLPAEPAPPTMFL